MKDFQEKNLLVGSGLYAVSQAFPLDLVYNAPNEETKETIIEEAKAGWLADAGSFQGFIVQPELILPTGS